MGNTGYGTVTETEKLGSPPLTPQTKPTSFYLVSFVWITLRRKYLGKERNPSFYVTITEPDQLAFER